MERGEKWYEDGWSNSAVAYSSAGVQPRQDRGRKSRSLRGYSRGNVPVLKSGSKPRGSLVRGVLSAVTDMHLYSRRWAVMVYDLALCVRDCLVLSMPANVAHNHFMEHITETVATSSPSPHLLIPNSFLCVADPTIAVMDD